MNVDLFWWVLFEEFQNMSTKLDKGKCFITVMFLISCYNFCCACFGKWTSDVYFWMLPCRLWLCLNWCCVRPKFSWAHCCLYSSLQTLAGRLIETWVFLFVFFYFVKFVLYSPQKFLYKDKYRYMLFIRIHREHFIKVWLLFFSADWLQIVSLSKINLSQLSHITKENHSSL